MLATQDRIDRMARLLIKDMGPHLSYLTGNIRQALVAQAVLGIVTAQDDGHVINADDIHLLHLGIVRQISIFTGDDFYFR